MISFDKKSDVAIKFNYIRGTQIFPFTEPAPPVEASKLRTTRLTAQALTAAIQLDGGARGEIAGNRITYSRTADGGYGIILLNTVNALVAENSIGSRSKFALSGSIVTEKSQSTKVVNNLVMKGSMKLNDKTDTNLGNTMIG